MSEWLPEILLKIFLDEIFKISVLSSHIIELFKSKNSPNILVLYKFYFCAPWNRFVIFKKIMLKKEFHGNSVSK